MSLPRTPLQDLKNTPLTHANVSKGPYTPVTPQFSNTSICSEVPEVPASDDVALNALIYQKVLCMLEEKEQVGGLSFYRVKNCIHLHSLLFHGIRNLNLSCKRRRRWVLHCASISCKLCSLILQKFESQISEKDALIIQLQKALTLKNETAVVCIPH
jgi:hypothetical protein